MWERQKGTSSDILMLLLIFRKHFGLDWSGLDLHTDSSREWCQITSIIPGRDAVPMVDIELLSVLYCLCWRLAHLHPSQPAHVYELTILCSTMSVSSQHTQVTQKSSLAPTKYMRDIMNDKGDGRSCKFRELQTPSQQKSDTRQSNM
jgi:hypothetical protein